MNKKQAIYWLSLALQVHDEPEIVEAFKIAMEELAREADCEELTKISAIYT